MTQFQTYRYTEWDTTYELHKIGEVEVLAIQDVCTLLNSLTPKAEQTPPSIMEHMMSNFMIYDGAIYLGYKGMGVIKFRIDHYDPLRRSNSFNNIFLSNVATLQLIKELCEMSDKEAEEQIDQIFENSLLWF